MSKTNLAFSLGDAAGALKINAAGGPEKVGGPPFNAMGMPSEEINARLAKLCPKITVSFSGGKDSVAALLELRRHNFEDIKPIYYYTVPGLSFVEETLDYYERFFGVKVVRVPGPGVYRMLKHNVFQTPARADALEAIDRKYDGYGIPQFTFEQIRTRVCEDLGWPDTTFNATGVRSMDTPRRAMIIKRVGPVQWMSRRWDAVYDWNMERLTREITQSGVKLAQDYHSWKRSFDGIAWHTVVPLAYHYPEDYKRLLEWFPLAELQVFRYEIAKKRGLLKGRGT
jgi:hypothetical protein